MGVIILLSWTLWYGMCAVAMCVFIGLQTLPGGVAQMPPSIKEWSLTKQTSNRLLMNMLTVHTNLALYFLIFLSSHSSMQIFVV